MGLRIGFFITLLYFTSVLCTTPSPSTTASWILMPSDPPKEPIRSDQTKENNKPVVVPKISSMKVHSNVTNRFAITRIASKVKNFDENSQEAVFEVVLPETAYISGFIMEIDGKQYEAYVQEKEEAKKTYDAAVSSGIAAGHVAVNARDSKRFTVSVNIEPQSKATFYLTYEELLKRQNGQYDIVINLHPGQLVKDLEVQVNINETRLLTVVKVPSLRSGNEISKNDEKLDPKAEIERIGKNAAKVIFTPDIERQKELAINLGSKEGNGLAGQFVVQYDVERDPQGGEILVADDYFVHFFAPTELKPLPKHMVFVLDTSGSMFGRKMSQLKEAMKSILDQLNAEDTFNIIQFHSVVEVWNIPKAEVQYAEGTYSSWRFGDIVKNETEEILPGSFEVSSENIKQAKNVMEKLYASGGTNIYSALTVTLKLLKKNNKKNERQSIIMFLTDGEATNGETNPENIVSKISKQNAEEVPIFALSFGHGADRSFLEKLSLRNQGFARHIYEGADASLQLQSFYKYISSPLLSKVNFQYVSQNVSRVTKTEFPILFDGSELVVAGRYLISQEGNRRFLPVITCDLGPHFVEYKPTFAKPIGSLEKHWAYLTLKQILDERDAADNKRESTKKALDIALKYSFVTPVSSLVVVKPNDTKAEANPEDASKDNYSDNHSNHHYLQQPLSDAIAPSFASRPSAPLAPTLEFRPSAPGVVAESEEIPIRFASDSFDPISKPATLPPQRPSPTEIATAQQVSQTVLSLTSSLATFDKLKKELPWLVDIFNTANGTLNLPKGQFILDNEGSVLQVLECPITPLNGTGSCVLLKQCPQVYNLLTDSNTYSQYFCPLLQWAGVCCPTSKPEDLSKPSNVTV